MLASCRWGDEDPGLSLLVRLFALVAVAVVPAIVAQLYGAYELQRDRERMAHTIALDLARFASSELERTFEGIRGVMVTLAALPPIRGRDAPACVALLREFRGQYPYLFGIGAVDREGRVFCAIDDFNPGLSIADRPYFTEAMSQDDLVVGTFAIGRQQNAPVLPLALRFHGADGQPAGVLVAPLRLDWLQQQFQAKGLPEDSTVTIVDRQGTIIGRVPDPRWVGRAAPAYLQAVLRADVPGSIAAESTQTLDGISRVFGYVPLRRPLSEVFIAVGIAEPGDAVGRDVLVWGMVISTAGLVLALGAAWLIGRGHVVGPIERLRDAARRWTEGDLHARVTGEVPGSEFSQLARAFNTLATSLEAREREHQRSLAQFRILINELNHRTKNSLATMQAMARQTARSVGDLKAFVPAFEARLFAYSRAHELLAENRWQATPLRKLAEAVLSPFGAERPGRVERSGPDVSLNPQTALSLALWLGELSTNAAKYGALSVTSGCVRLEWSVKVSEETRPRLSLAWSESGGPAVSPPSREGFGMRLLRQLAAGLQGTIDVRFEPSGLSCRLEFPLAPPDELSALAEQSADSTPVK